MRLGRAGGEGAEDGRWWNPQEGRRRTWAARQGLFPWAGFFWAPDLVAGALYMDEKAAKTATWVTMLVGVVLVLPFGILAWNHIDDEDARVGAAFGLLALWAAPAVAFSLKATATKRTVQRANERQAEAEAIRGMQAGGTPTIPSLLRTFLVDYKERTGRALTAHQLDLLRAVVNSGFEQHNVEAALQHPDPDFRALAAKLLDDVGRIRRA